MDGVGAEFLSLTWEASFALAALCLAATGRAAKRVVGHPRPGWRRLFWQTLPVHPVLVGAALGAASSLPVAPGFESPAGRCLYFAGAGVMSTWLYDVVHSWAKRSATARPGDGM